MMGSTKSAPLGLILGAVMAAAALGAAPASPGTASTAPLFTPPPNLPRSDANGNAIRFSPRTGHISNYDDAKVPPYTLPDPLKFANGDPVKDEAAWMNKRRPEILKAYQEEIYGKVPDRAPKVTFEVTSTDAAALGGTVIVKHIAGHIGPAGGPTMNLLLVLPAKATEPVPVIFSILFLAPPNPGPGAPTAAVATVPAAPAGGRAGRGGGGGGGAGDTAPLADVLSHGYAYAALRYTDIQPDAVNTFNQGVIGLSLAPDQKVPAPNEWGTISAWAWGISRVMDYLETEKAVDAKRVAIVGHSRLGKTVLWAGAQDPRIALVFSSCGGEMGSALARRDFGETVDDMTQNFPWQFAGNLQKYAGHWNDMPVDAHMLISLSAPRPVYITGGTTDQWSDPKGEFLAEVAAGPVYRLLGKKDLGDVEFKPDTPYTAGDLGFHYHTGAHAILPADWAAFFPFADAHLKPKPTQ
ncbi:MAG TPA: acetylxylan esterase [Phycisphaerae bacterium]|jgi:hypothetical protein